MSSVAIAQMPEIEEIIFPAEMETTRETSFQIDDQEKASWAARRILQSQKRIAERQDTAKQFKQRIDSWLTQANRGDEETIERLEAILEPYLEEELSGKKRGKSLQLFGAVISLRKQPEKVFVVDSDKAIAYCKDKHPDALIIKTDLSKSELKRLVKEGTFIPGVLLDGGGEKLYVKES
jgi:hypothetical protein